MCVLYAQAITMCDEIPRNYHSETFYYQFNFSTQNILHENTQIFVNLCFMCSFQCIFKAKCVKLFVLWCVFFVNTEILFVLIPLKMAFGSDVSVI